MGEGRLIALGRLSASILLASQRALPGANCEGDGLIFALERLQGSRHLFGGDHLRRRSCGRETRGRRPGLDYR